MLWWTDLLFSVRTECSGASRGKILAVASVAGAQVRVSSSGHMEAIHDSDGEVGMGRGRWDKGRRWDLIAMLPGMVENVEKWRLGTQFGVHAW